MATVQTRYDQQRGCGWRKEGGLYLVAEGPNAHCGRMPLLLTICASCGQGIKPSRGYTWLTIPAALIEAEPRQCCERHCEYCPLSPFYHVERVGLLWCGEQFYKQPSDWLNEAREQGISRRIAAVPRGFEPGKTWVLIGHRKAVSGIDDKGKMTMVAGIIYAFRPTIEYVIRGDESAEELDALEQRGVTPVRVERVTAEQPLPLG